MRRSCLSVLLSFGISVAAEAASVTFNWIGFYVGGNVGNSSGIAATDTTVVGIGGPGSILAHSDTLRLNSIVGGAQFGYNWRV